MSETPYTEVLAVTLDGRPLPPGVAALLVEGWVDASVNVPAAFQLVFQDPNHRVLAALGVRIGSRAVLRGLADGVGGERPLLTGEVTALETDFDGGGSFTVVRGLDFGHRLLRGRRVAAYRQMTASDIARRIAGQRGLAVGRIEPTRTVYEQLTQPGVSDWEFLRRLAEENDAEVVFTDTGEFQFVGPARAAGAPGPGTPAKSSPYVLEKGRNLVRCRAGVTASDQVSAVTVRGWDVHAKRPLVAKAPATESEELLIGITPGQAGAPFGGAELLGSDVPYDTQAEVRYAASALAADVTGAFAELEAEVRGDPWLRPGTPVALGGVGAPFEGRYTATAVRHHFAADTGYRTWVTVSGRQHRSLHGLASGGRGEEARLPGAAVAVVTDVKDPLEQGRVKLSFPWLSDDYVSDWARTAQFGGERGGGVISPEVGDEVLVVFDRGALDHPYVLGGLYNGRDRPSRHDTPLVDRTSGRVNRRSLASRSGNRIELLDAPAGPRGVRLRTGDDTMTVHLDQSRSTITVRGDGRVSIQGVGAVSVSTTGRLSLSGGTVDIRAAAGLKLSAAELNLSAASVATEAASVRTAAASVAMVGTVTANGMPVI
ncbi:VgrG-related protein [Kitasatospora sp. NPDC056783]|uniref:VgrG-related protein n=1 Tax=Kitasatospora sp. NPDC056783 TaxID=3345943 RepID=UPI0036B63CB9